MLLDNTIYSAMKTNFAHIHYLTIMSLSFVTIFLFAACQPKPESSIGFQLPDGDIEKGKAAFVQLQCHRCHAISGVEFPMPPKGPRVEVPLGGKVYRVKTYGELVTSIINPTHIISTDYQDALRDDNGKSIMPDHNDEMTVQQMIDLVSFLQSRYKLTHPDYEYDFRHYDM